MFQGIKGGYLHYRSGVKQFVRDHFFEIQDCCVYCRREEWPMYIDHIYPIYKWGTNDIENLTVACKLCNTLKSCFTIDEFYDFLERKRDSAYEKCIKHILWLRLLRDGNRFHIRHTDEILSDKIIAFSKWHSYYTRIIQSLDRQLYKLY